MARAISVRRIVDNAGVHYAVALTAAHIHAYSNTATDSNGYACHPTYIDATAGRYGLAKHPTRN